MDDSGDLMAAFQDLIPDGVGVIQGTVTKVDPLAITAENDPKLVLPQPILIIPFHLQNYTTQIDIEWSGKYGAATIDSQTNEDGEHSHPDASQGGEHVNRLETFNIHGATITVHNALKVGEKVHLLSFNNGKKYYILDRVAAERKV